MLKRRGVTDFKACDGRPQLSRAVVRRGDHHPSIRAELSMANRVPVSLEPSQVLAGTGIPYAGTHPESSNDPESIGAEFDTNDLVELLQRLSGTLSIWWSQGRSESLGRQVPDASDVGLVERQ
jgi:hypothetical protein